MRAGEGGMEDDRFERQCDKFHASLRDAFRDIAKQNPSRVVVVDANRRQDSVASSVWNAVKERLLE